MTRKPERRAATRRSRAALAALGTAGLLLGGAPACNLVDSRPAPPPDAPSVLLVTVDTLRADHVGAYGARDVETPHMDALAAAGVRFETAITATPLTLPSHTSILTGMDPPDHGVRHNGTFKLGPEVTTLAERFREAGWATGAFVGAVVLKARYGLDQGFEVYDDDIHGDKAAPGGFVERRAGEVVDAALAWLGRTEDPFFLWVHLYDPHMDYKAPPEFAARFPDRPYDAEIAYADSQIGRLLGALRADGRLDRTLVVLTADHGESLGEHGETTHSSALYDSVLKVPLLMAGPSLPAGHVVPGVVRVKDIAPTVLARVGLPPLSEARGQDLSPWLSEAPPGAAREAPAGAAREGIAYAETLATMLDNGWAPLHAIRTDEWLYVRSPRAELYDVAADPHQLDNLVESDPERARPRQEALDALVEAALANEKEAIGLEVDDDTRAQLHALGYAISDGPVVQTGIDPKDGRRYLPLLHRAMGAYEAGQIELAEQLFLEVSQKLPGSARSHSQLASIYYQEGRLKRALRHIELALSFDPRTPLHHAVRAEILTAMGREDEAREAYRQAAAIDPEAPWSRVGRMWEALERGEEDAALRLARAALDDDPGNTGVSLRVAALFSEYGQYARAAGVIEEALRTNPNSRFAHMRLAIEYARLGRTEEALAHREQAGHLATSRKLGAVLGRAFAAHGDFDRAEWQLRAVLEAHPQARLARESLERVQAWREKLSDGDVG